MLGFLTGGFCMKVDRAFGSARATTVRVRAYMSIAICYANNCPCSLLTRVICRRRICLTELIRQQTVLPLIPEVTPLSDLFHYDMKPLQCLLSFARFLRAGWLSYFHVPAVQQSYRYAKDTYTSLHGTAVVSCFAL